MSKRERYYLDIVLLVAWCALIFFFSGIPSLSSGLKEDFILRKTAHAGEYAVLAYLFYNVFRRRTGPVWFVILISGLCALVYAFTDEIHQTFVPGRSGNLFDVGIDSIGITVGLLLILLVWFFKRIKVQS